MKTFLLSVFAAFAGLIGSFDSAAPLSFEDKRDGNTYEYVELNGLHWFTENLRYETPNSICVSDSNAADCHDCGQFYLLSDAMAACPDPWRLPTPAEIKSLLKAQRKQKFSLVDTLNIWLCGRVDYGKLTRIGEQNTFWLAAKLNEGSIMHWHTFGQEQELHDHNVVQAKRQFPLRCVCELDK